MLGLTAYRRRTSHTIPPIKSASTAASGSTTNRIMDNAVSPTTMRNFRAAEPLEFLAWSVTVCSPAFFREPVMSPDLASSFRPSGSFSDLAELD